MVEVSGVVSGRVFIILRILVDNVVKSYLLRARDRITDIKNVRTC